jgi:uncharacterized protein (TIGR00369 family)
METVKLDKCFGCGKDNPIGLHLNTTYIEDKAHIEFEVKPDYCGYPGLLHGGLTALLLDEVMYYAIKKLDIVAVTVSLKIDYIRPGLVGHTLICEAQIVSQDGRRLDVTGEIKDAVSGKLIAKAKGKYLEVDLDKVLNS